MVYEESDPQEDAPDEDEDEADRRRGGRPWRYRRMTCWAGVLPPEDEEEELHVLVLSLRGYGGGGAENSQVLPSSSAKFHLVLKLALDGK